MARESPRFCPSRVSRIVQCPARQLEPTAPPAPLSATWKDDFAPATHTVLGGTIVGYRASELIGILALAVQARLRTDALVDTLMAYPSLSESLTDAAE